MSWRATLAGLRKRFERDPNVLAIARGVKISRGEMTSRDAVVFFLARKQPRPARPLPTTVVDLREDGTRNSARRYPTDVRELTLARPCSSGRRIERVLAHGAGAIERGTLSLAFDAQLESVPRRRLLLGCSHVFADVWGRRPLDDYRLRGIGDGGRRYTATPVARTRARSRGREFALAYDAALARLVSGAAAVPCWSIPRLRRTLRGLHARPLRLRQPLCCLGAATGRVVTGALATLGLRAPLEYRRGGRSQLVQVANLYELAGVAAASGDSGGLVFLRDRAVGLVVGELFDAKLQRWTTVFHRLSSLASHLQRLQGGGVAAALLEGPP